MTTQTNTIAGGAITIDAANMGYRDLNDRIRRAADDGFEKIMLTGVCGQRYIGDGICRNVKIDIAGIPGNDLGMFMNGPEIFVHGNGQDGVGNTMTNGEIAIDGFVGDVLAHSFRGGRIYVRGSAGYRCAIHMKEYAEPVPAVVIGGTAGAYAGEYMAGGVLIILGLDREKGKPLTGRYLGTGMHAGAIYLRGDVEDRYMGAEISRVEMNDKDRQRLEQHVGRFAELFGLNAKKILDAKFTKFLATSKRPYGKLYVY